MTTQINIESEAELQRDTGALRANLVRVAIPFFSILMLWFVARGVIVGTLSNMERFNGHFVSDGFSWTAPDISLRLPAGAPTGMLTIVGNANHDSVVTVSCQGSPDFQIKVQRGLIRQTLPPVSACRDGAMHIRSDWSFVPSPTGDSRKLAFQVYEVRSGGKVIPLADLVSASSGIYAKEAVRVSTEPEDVLTNRADAGWYKGIVTTGYKYNGDKHEQQNVAWPFLYPYLAKAAQTLTGLKVEAVLINLNAALLLAAMITLYALGRMSRLSQWQSLLAPAWLAFNPFAFFLVGGFSETLFVALEFVGLVFMLKRWYYAAAIAVALMSATRFAGALAYFWIAGLIIFEPWFNTRKRIFMLASTAVLSSFGILADIAIKWKTTGYPLAAFQVRAAWTPSRFGPFKLFLRPLDLMHGEYVFACIPLIALGTYAIYCVWEATRDKYDRRTLLLLCGGLSMAILSIVISGDFHANGRYFLTFAPAIIGILRADGASTKCHPVLGIAMTVGAAFMVFNTVLIEMGLPPN
ncbi:hypothetical protein OKW50_003649 [Paraburkholderia youngii]|uniref:hypothetical protein n=1 Tax=Paraburkholderia youngii TaxID=2782701 RepID=UPI003D232833